MGNTRTLIAWLAVVGLQLIPYVTYADDVRPGREVRAIRHDLPIIMGTQTGPKLFVDAVIVSRDKALVQVHDAYSRDVYLLTHRLGTWWFDDAIGIDEDTGFASACWPGVGAQADADGVTPDLLRRLRVPSALIALAEQGLPTVASAQVRAARHVPSPAKTLCDFWPGELLLQSEPDSTDLSGSLFRLNALFAKSDAPVAAMFVNVLGRPPTEGESWKTQLSNGYFFFSMMLQSPTTVHIGAGTQLNVWFPFALDPSKTYSLTLAHVDPIVGPINGVLKDNTLHFVLPALTVSPGAEIMGEIDGDPYDR